MSINLDYGQACRDKMLFEINRGRGVRRRVGEDRVVRDGDKGKG